MAHCMTCIILHLLTLLKSFEKSDIHEEDWRILAEERAPSSVKDGVRN